MLALLILLVLLLLVKLLLMVHEPLVLKLHLLGKSFGTNHVSLIYAVRNAIFDRNPLLTIFWDIQFFNLFLSPSVYSKIMKTMSMWTKSIRTKSIWTTSIRNFFWRFIFPVMFPWISAATIKNQIRPHLRSWAYHPLSIIREFNYLKLMLCMSFTFHLFTSKPYLLGGPYFYWAQ